jgi:DNA gyrase/topoisomerase IV subunit B
MLQQKRNSNNKTGGMLIRVLSNCAKHNNKERFSISPLKNSLKSLSITTTGIQVDTHSSQLQSGETSFLYVDFYS